MPVNKIKVDFSGCNDGAKVTAVLWLFRITLLVNTIKVDVSCSNDGAEVCRLAAFSRPGHM